MASKNCSIFLIVFSVVITSCTGVDKPKHQSNQINPAKKIADYYGASKFKNVSSIAFTFNVKKNNKNIHRSWYWEPKNDLVKFFPEDKELPVTYSRKLIKNADDELLKIDGWFNNDQYWLLFPLHLLFDKNIKVTMDSSKHKLPIGEGYSNRAVVEYTGNAGYTPNDKYELFIDDDYKIIQWIYRRNNSAKPTRLTKWEDYKNLEPLILSLNRPGIDSTFRVWFTNVELK